MQILKILSLYSALWKIQSCKLPSKNSICRKVHNLLWDYVALGVFSSDIWILYWSLTINWFVDTLFCYVSLKYEIILTLFMGIFFGKFYLIFIALSIEPNRIFIFILNKTAIMYNFAYHFIQREFIESSNLLPARRSDPAQFPYMYIKII